MPGISQNKKMLLIGFDIPENSIHRVTVHKRVLFWQETQVNSPEDIRATIDAVGISARLDSSVKHRITTHALNRGISKDHIRTFSTIGMVVEWVASMLASVDLRVDPDSPSPPKEQTSSQKPDDELVPWYPEKPIQKSAPPPQEPAPGNRAEDPPKADVNVMQSARDVQAAMNALRAGNLGLADRTRLVAEQFRRSTTWVTYHLDLLNLAPEVQKMLDLNNPAETHLYLKTAVLISKIKDHRLQVLAARQIMKEGLDHRRAYNLIRNLREEFNQPFQSRTRNAEFR